MKERPHEFQISANELDYLKQIVSDDESLTRLLTNRGATRGNKVSIPLECADAERLRAYLTERLATFGFQKDYSLTEQGQMLEELIDRFYLP